jgi:hypothetical protein
MEPVVDVTGGLGVVEDAEDAAVVVDGVTHK